MLTLGMGCMSKLDSTSLPDVTSDLCQQVLLDAQDWAKGNVNSSAIHARWSRWWVCNMHAGRGTLCHHATLSTGLMGPEWGKICGAQPAGYYVGLCGCAQNMPGYPWSWSMREHACLPRWCGSSDGHQHGNHCHTSHESWMSILIQPDATVGMRSRGQSAETRGLLWQCCIINFRGDTPLGMPPPMIWIAEGRSELCQNWLCSWPESAR